MMGMDFSSLPNNAEKIELNNFYSGIKAEPEHFLDNSKKNFWYRT